MHAFFLSASVTINTKADVALVQCTYITFALSGFFSFSGIGYCEIKISGGVFAQSGTIFRRRGIHFPRITFQFDFQVQTLRFFHVCT